MDVEFLCPVNQNSNLLLREWLYVFLFTFHSIPCWGNCTFLKTYFKTLLERIGIICICIYFSVNLIWLMRVRCSTVPCKQLLCSLWNITCLLLEKDRPSLGSISLHISPCPRCWIQGSLFCQICLASWWFLIHILDLRFYCLLHSSFISVFSSVWYPSGIFNCHN